MFYPYFNKVSLSIIVYLCLKLRNEKPHFFKEQLRINSCIPPYPSNSFDRFIDILVNKKRLPHSINLAVTSKCPYNCPHCSYGKRKKEDLSTDKMLGLVEEIKGLGTAILGITGGEPMLRDDLDQIISAAQPEMTTNIFSTGYAFEEKKAEKLSKAGVGMITIGVESTDNNIQDRIRGKKGSLEIAINAINLCKKYKIYPAIGTIGTRERIQNGELDRIYNFGKSFDVGEMRLIFPAATGNWTGSTHEILRNEELQLLKEFQIKYNKKPAGPVVASLAYLESEEMMGCNTGSQYLFIDAGGEVCPCDLMPLSFGNVTEKSLKEIWKEMQKHFPRPRPSCLMNEIAHKISTNNLPVPKNESIKLIPKFDECISLPAIYKKIKK
jgi:MoaA/NifB/PqqE/SkfB family radical SAM enzyme